MGSLTEVKVPDIGDFKEVDLIEVMVSAGDHVKAEDPLITLESDKATMEVPSPHAGTVKEVKVSAGDKVSEGSLILTMEIAADTGEPAVSPEVAVATMAPDDEAPTAKPEPAAPAPADAAPERTDVEARREPVSAPGPRPAPTAGMEPPATDVDTKAHATPSVRRFARELGVDLSRITGTGRKGRILKDDVQRYVKEALAKPAAAPAGALPMPEIPEVDFSKFGEIETQPLSRINKLSGANLHRTWLQAPHVTQHDLADITELEDFRRSLKDEAEARGVRITLLTFLMKAAVAALKTFPVFNASLAPDGENLILKRYFHVGVAVDTPQGLVVPVIRDVDRKSIFELATELTETSEKAREKKLTPGDMQGGCFTISSLGGIGGTAFTPILNAPEVAILGVARSSMQPVYVDGQFVPRLMLPLSLSYDHRVIDGAAGARFITYFGSVLADIRRLLL